MLYEMATGERPFHGESTTAVFSSILRDTPTPLTEVRPELPRDLEKVVRRCLAKDPEERLQAAKDLRNELKELKAEVPQRPASRKSLLKVGGVVAALVLAVLLAWVVGQRPRDDDIPRFANAVQVTTASGQELSPSWSPDGSRLAYMSDQNGNWDIWVTEVGSGVPLNRTADFGGDDMFPSWSPDGRNIAFRSARDGGCIFIMPSLAGPPRRVSRPGTPVPQQYNQSFSPRWSADGRELAYVVRESDRWSIEIASLETETFRRLSLPSDTDGCWDLSWSPNGRFFAYLNVLNMAVSYPRLVLLDISTSEVQLVTNAFLDVQGPTWSDDGRDLYFVANPGGSMDLYRQALTDSGAPEGSARAVTVGVGMNASAVLSPDGKALAYSKGGIGSNVWRVPIHSDPPVTWMDAEQLTFDEAYVEFVDISPEGQRVLITSYKSGNGEIYVLPSEGGEMRQLTDHPALDNDGTWSPDGSEIAFYSNRAGDRDIWIMPANGGPVRRLTDGPGEDCGPAWSPDGQMIAFDRGDRLEVNGIYVVPARGGTPQRLVSHPDSLLEWASWSPDGQWIVYEQRPGVGRAPEFFLWRIPSAGGTPERLMEGTGMRPQWSPKGDQIFFYRESQLWSLALADGRERPVTDFEGRPGRIIWSGNFSTDGNFLYFIWGHDRSDIWVMDVVTDE